MHELGIMTGVMESVEEAARNAGATKVLEIDLSVGVMTEAVEDALSPSRRFRKAPCAKVPTSKSI